jgi:hypothetical protein
MPLREENQTKRNETNRMEDKARGKLSKRTKHSSAFGEHAGFGVLSLCEASSQHWLPNSVAIAKKIGSVASRLSEAI